MIAGVADTHAALWYLLRDERLSPNAMRFIDGAAASGHDIVISAISLAEIVCLVEKGRLPEAAYRDLVAALADPEYVIEEAPLNAEIVDIMRQVPRGDVPDMPDRIVAATGVYFNVPVISRDSRIRAARIETIWCYASYFSTSN